MLLGFFIIMALTIDNIDGLALVTKPVGVNGSATFVIHFIVGDTAVIVAKLETRSCTSVYRAKHIFNT